MSDGDARTGARAASAARAATPIALTSLVLVLFLPFAFSTDFIEGITDTVNRDWVQKTPALPRLLTVPVDIVLIGLAVSLGRRARRQAHTGTRASRGLIAAGALLTLVVDFVFLAVPIDSTIGNLLVSMLYLPALVLLWAGILGTGLPSRRAPTTVGKRAFMAAMPLAVGVGAAYVGQTLYWDELRADASRVDQEYFAQISQVLPLLAVALGVESRVASGGLTLEPAERAVGLFTIVLLVGAEALALSALPVDNVEVPLYPWHEYVAFVVTLYACFVSLCLLAVVLAISLRPGGGRAAI